LNLFPWVNGRLFGETLPMASFNSKMRELILDCAGLDWSLISPAIFGSLFQSTMNPGERRNLGAHYTSEKNIMKAIGPLFLDELYKEFNTIKANRNKLKEFHKKIAGLKFLDPASGCGNFLVISYRELRILELQILKVLQESDQLALSIDDLVLVHPEQFYGIEIEEWPCRIAEVAMWLMEHQMNMKMSEELGQYYVRLPLQKSANILNGNALDIDWQSLLQPLNTVDVVAKHTNIYIVSEPAQEYNTLNVQTDSFAIHRGPKPEPKPEIKFDYIFGNPPFIGSKMMTDGQRAEIRRLYGNISGSGTLDYVSGWYKKAAEYIGGTNIRAAFVSTNSITQGEQVAVIWNELTDKHKIEIDFAHRTFKWSNEGRGIAAVYCVIIGFSCNGHAEKSIFEYGDIKGEPHLIRASNINPYLVDAKNILIGKRQKPLCRVPEMNFGNMPNDNGNLILSDSEKSQIIAIEPNIEKYIKPLISAREFINGEKRWCLWLLNVPPNEIRLSGVLLKRIELVKNYRLDSRRPSTRKLAQYPTLFGEIRQPNTDYVLIPRVSSENRKYIPIGFFDSNYIVSDTCMSLPDATLFHFAVLTSEMHMAWVRNVCGRLKSDFRYSKDIVYNNFPWPDDYGEREKAAVEAAATHVLDVRTKFQNPTKGKPASFADLYNTLTMPPDLVKAHMALDKAVDRCYRSQPFSDEVNRMEFLLGLYEKYTASLMNVIKKSK